MKGPAVRLERTKGFTLLEALIALLVLAGGLLALAQFHAAALLNSADAKARTQASNLADSKMNEQRTFYSSLGFEAVSALPEASAEDSTASTPVGDFAVPYMDWGEKFERYWPEVDDDIDSDGNPDNAKRVQVNVDWTDPRGVAQSIKLESIIQNYDPYDVGLALRP